MAELWSDYTDSVITAVDKQLGSKYKASVRALLTDPTKYASQQNVQTTISNMREDVDNYFNERLKGMAQEQKAAEDAAFRANALTKQLSQEISTEAKQANISILKPAASNRDITKDEQIFVDSVTPGMLVKLVNRSNIILDLSTTYKSYNIGNWLLSGTDKNYLVSVFMPQSAVLLMEASRGELDALFQSASDYIKGL